jgi:hypothetical protein
MNKRFPNLYIIGAMKAGTTSLHDYLALHPDIFMSTPKEIHFYDENHFYKYDYNWYLKHFKTDKKIVGTSPQGYSKCHHKDSANVIERMYKDTPDAKLIYIVRDPIERYRSHILEAYHGDPEHDIIYSLKVDNFVKTSMYYMQISAFLKFFKKEQIHILSLEDLISDKAGELNKIFAFLGVKKLDNFEEFNFQSNRSTKTKLPFIVKKNITYKIINKINPDIALKYGIIYSHIFYKNRIEKKKLSNKEFQLLKNKLQDDINKFREFTGMKFSNWQI